MDAVSGFLLVIMAVTQSGEGTSITTVPTVYENKRSLSSKCEAVTP